MAESLATAWCCITRIKEEIIEGGGGGGQEPE